MRWFNINMNQSADWASSFNQSEIGDRFPCLLALIAILPFHFRVDWWPWARETTKMAGREGKTQSAAMARRLNGR